MNLTLVIWLISLFSWIIGSIIALVYTLLYCHKNRKLERKYAIAASIVFFLFLAFPVLPIIFAFLLWPLMILVFDITRMVFGVPPSPELSWVVPMFLAAICSILFYRYLAKKYVKPEL